MITKRIKKLQGFLNKNQCALITGDAARFYFTGFKASAGTVAITSNSAYFLIDFRYYEKAAAESDGCTVILCEKLYSQLSALLSAESITEILIEADCVTLSEFEGIKKGLSDFLVSSDRQLSTAISDMRSIKAQGEVESIKKAQRLTDETFSYILGKIAPGISETEIMLDMEFFARSRFSEGTAFDFIVVSGKNSSLPHGVPSRKKIENGDFVTMDFGCVINGYRSDMTRTVAVGSISEKQRRVYETVLKAQLSAIEAIKPDIPCKEIDAVARNIINSAGFEGCFGHGLGHGVGIEIHEKPAFNTRDNTPLRSGMIMTVEPGIYLADEFGVRIEDMGLVTENGFENFTESTKELIVL